MDAGEDEAVGKEAGGDGADIASGPDFGLADGGLETIGVEGFEAADFGGDAASADDALSGGVFHDEEVGVVAGARVSLQGILHVASLATGIGYHPVKSSLVPRDVEVRARAEMASDIMLVQASKLTAASMKLIRELDWLQRHLR